MATGCKPDVGARGEGALAIPPSGSARVVAVKVEESAARVHWKWSVIGERNWKQATAEGKNRVVRMTLAQTYALNSVSERGGCNIWECDLLVTRAAKPTDPATYVVTLHGSDGATVTTQGTVASSGDKLPVDIAQSVNTVPRLPADVALATIGDIPVTLRIAD